MSSADLHYKKIVDEVYVEGKWHDGNSDLLHKEMKSTEIPNVWVNMKCI